MTGADIIAVIILIALAIAIGVYLLHWLYRRSSKEVSFVRTGMGGEKVVLSGGAFVLPIIHNVSTVGMRTMRIQVGREGAHSLITKNRMRVEIIADFYVRVEPTPEAVATAAGSLGKRTLDPDSLRELVQGRFADALGTIAATMTMEEIQEKRSAYVSAVKALVEDSLSETGLEIEAVSLTSLDQAALEVFNPSNAFDAEGLTQLTEQIELRKKKRNDIEQDTAIKIRTKNLQAQQQALEIDREHEFSRLLQEREIANSRARAQAEMAIELAEQERVAEQAKILAVEEVEKARISQKDRIEVQRILREHELTLQIEERRKQRNEIERDTEIEIQKKNLEAEIHTLEVAKANEFARLEQQQEIAARAAEQRTKVTKDESVNRREAEEIELKVQQEIKVMQIQQQQTIEATRIAHEELVQLRELEKRSTLEVQEQERKKAVVEKVTETIKADQSQQLAQAELETAREQVESARELEIAERDKKVEIIRAEQSSEREAIQLTTLARAEREASEQREQADKFNSMAEQLRFEVQATGARLMNEAENARSDESRLSTLRMQLANNLDSIIRESVRPMENIEAIKIYEVNGLPGLNGASSGGSGGGAGGGGAGNGEGGGSLSDNIVNSALRYRAQMPFVDNLLGEIGMAPGEISNIRNLLGDIGLDSTDKKKAVVSETDKG